MPDPILESLLADVQAANDRLRAYVTDVSDDFVPLKEAQEIWGVPERTARARATICGEKRFGRWQIRRSLLHKRQ